MEIEGCNTEEDHTFFSPLNLPTQVSAPDNPLKLPLQLQLLMDQPKNEMWKPHTNKCSEDYLI